MSVYQGPARPCLLDNRNPGSKTGLPTCCAYHREEAQEERRQAELALYRRTHLTGLHDLKAVGCPLCPQEPEKAPETSLQRAYAVTESDLLIIKRQLGAALAGHAGHRPAMKTALAVIAKYLKED